MNSVHTLIDTRHAPAATADRETDSWEALLASPRTKALRLSQHEVVYYEGDPADRLYEVIDGAVMLVKLLPDGRRQVVGILGRGDIFGMPAGEDQDSTAETLVPSVLRAIERRDVRDSAVMQSHINACLLRQIAGLRDHSVLLGRKSAFERVASFLIHLVPGRGLGEQCVGRADGGQDEAVVRITMTRQEIADYLGLTIETVSRIISDMKRKGFLAADRQDRLRIVDVCALCRKSGSH